MATYESDDYSDASSIANSSLASETASLSSSIFNYEYENGRRYHAYKAGNYVVPNDDQEQDRLEILHHVHAMMLGGDLFAAPVKNPQTILDVGTGTGLWAIEVADLYPDAKIIATDLSAIQPEWVPSNVTFEIDDIEADWNFPHKFDYIHLRNMGGSIADWQALLNKCYDGLNPGGYIEVRDGEAWGSSDDNTFPEGGPYHQWLININAAARKFGRDMNIIPQMKGFIKEAGFEDVEDKIVPIHLNQWDAQSNQPKYQKEWATYMTVVMMETLESYSPALFTRVLGWSCERLEELLKGARADLKNPRHHLYTNFHHVYGRKPEA